MDALVAAAIEDAATMPMMMEASLSASASAASPSSPSFAHHEPQFDYHHTHAQEPVDNYHLSPSSSYDNSYHKALGFQ